MKLIDSNLIKKDEILKKDNHYLEPILLEKQLVLNLLQNFVLDTMIKILRCLLKVCLWEL